MLSNCAVVWVTELSSAELYCEIIKVENENRKYSSPCFSISHELDTLTGYKYTYEFIYLVFPPGEQHFATLPADGSGGYLTQSELSGVINELWIQTICCFKQAAGIHRYCSSHERRGLKQQDIHEIWEITQQFRVCLKTMWKPGYWMS